MALIYIVEDDENIREIETIALQSNNHQIYAFEQAGSFWKQMESILPELILLDVMLPDENGYEIVRKLRKKRETRKIPVIMVTAKTTEMDMVRGLEDGADDYIRKPFSVMELLSRIKALLRRTQEEEPQLLQVGTIELNNDSHNVSVDGKTLDLTFKEYELLRYLMINAGTVMTREMIMHFVWDTDYEGESRTIDMHIKTLRQKLGKEGYKIRTVRNVGYVMDKEG